MRELDIMLQSSGAGELSATQDLISVIIPVYNVEQYLDRCMQSVLSQTYCNLEVILVDDKSSDRSNEMCITYLADPRVVVVHGQNKGLSGARNSGLEVAKGKYVIFVDSDDYIESDMVENLYDCLVKNHADTVIGGFKRIIGSKSEIRNNPFTGKVFKNKEDIKNQVLKKMIATNGVDHIEMSVWKVLFSMDIIRKNNLIFPDKKYLCEDIIFDFAYYPLAKCVAMSNDTGYCYCLNQDSLSQMYQANKFERISFQRDEMRKRIIQAEMDEEAYIRLDNFYVGNLLHHMKTMAANGKKIGKKNILKEYRQIYATIKNEPILWKALHKCYNGKDKIPLYLLEHGRITSLYAFYQLLTSFRRIVRG